jgi:hypothetical protein
MPIYIIFLIVVPIAMFFSAFVVARQLRALQNVPIVSMMFVQRKWLMSAIMGGFISGFFSVLALLDSKFSAWSILAFVLMFLIASASYYFGVSLGWGNSSSVSENITPVDKTQVDTLPENIVVDNTFNSVRIAINTQKRWGWFAMSLFQLIIVGLCALPIFGLMIVSLLQNYLPESMKVVIWIVMGGLVLYLIYTKFQEALEYIFDKEIIEIDNLSVKIEKYGSGFKSRKEYSADNIKKIATVFSISGTNVSMRRSPFVNSNMPAFMMWHNHGVKRFRWFGRAVDLADAQRILEMVYSKFPQYKG